MGLADRAEDRFRTYSLGMKQRLAIAATLLKDPDLLIFDEPTNGLDPAGIHEIRATMRGLADRGKTVLVSSHILSEVQQVADTVTIIGRGRLLAEGTVAEILDAAGGQTARVGVADLAGAAEVLARAGFVVTPNGRQLGVASTNGRLDLAQITQLLAERGHYVNELVPLRRDLESVFLRAHQGRAPRRHPAGWSRPQAARPAAPGGTMIRLIRAEVDRLLSRRFTKIALVVVLLVIASFQVAAYFEMQPPTQSELADAQRFYSEQHRDWVLNHESYEQECVDAGGTPTDCAYPEPQLSDFVFVQSFEDVARGSVQISIYLVAMTALMIGGSFIGAEFSSGSIANWLSFIPRRGQVYASKLVTVAGFSAVVSAIAAALTIAAVVGIARWQDVTVVGLERLIGTGARGVLIAIALAIVGFCISLVGRHTAAAIGTLLGYLFIWFVRNGILGESGWAARLTPWSPEGNISAIVSTKHIYYIQTQRVTAEGVMFDQVEQSVNLVHGLTYWGILLAVVIVGTGLIFRRRDIS